MIYQDLNFKICLSLFGWKENILYKQHIVHCETSIKLKRTNFETTLLRSVCQKY